MSKTFPARPSVKTRSQGASSTASSSNNSSENRLGGGRTRTLVTRGRGRGVNQVCGADAKTTKAGSRSVNSTNARMQQNRMNEFPGFGMESSPRRPQRQQSTEESRSQQAQHSGGFTVIPPNARKRDKINEMARRESQNYERFKQENSSKHYSYVGTTGGGEMTEDMVRRRQAIEVKNQKSNRMQKQQQWREDRREAEQREIDLKRSEARRKAEENASRGRTANQEDLRRKREAFLQRVENQDRNQ